MTERDPELARLLATELARHLPTLQAATEDANVRRAVHALKGSAGLAGEHPLAKALERVERRMRAGDALAPRDAAELVRLALVRLRAGQVALETEWPEPPADLGLGHVEPNLRVQYASELGDRLDRIDHALARGDTELFESASEVFRHVHALKGAASAVGDEPMAWFCHGLEERLARSHTTRTSAEDALAEVSQWRAVLGALAHDPRDGLALLRASAPQAKGLVAVPTQRPTGRPDEERGVDDPTVRVSAAAIDRLLDRFESIGLVRELLTVRIQAGQAKAARLRHARAQLAEALRLIGPPRPWGAPALALRRMEAAQTMVAEIADELDVAVSMLRAHDQLLRESVTSAKRDLSTMRLTTTGKLFARLGTAIEAEARRQGRAVIVRAHRTDETFDRRIAERLVEPCLQLVRNALAHGIEPSTERIALGKPEAGTISLWARKAQNRLSITIQDDGAGVDMDAVRRRAVLAGALSEEAAVAADEHALLSLLFLPGLSTHEGSDLLAGRGIGLDITRNAVHRFGGTVRLSSRRGVGFSARIDLPVESGLENVLWVTANGETYAVPSLAVRAVRPFEPPPVSAIPHLATCLGAVADRPPALALEVQSVDEGEGTFVVGVDDIGQIDEVLVRPVSALVAGLGPWAGAILRGDGTLRLALDLDGLAQRVRTFETSLARRA